MIKTSTFISKPIFKRLNTFSLLILILVTKGLAQDTIRIRNEELMNIDSGVYIYEDKEGSLKINTIKEQKFTLSTQKVPNLGISRSVFWIRLTIKNCTALSTLLINLSQPTIDDVIYYPDSTGIGLEGVGENQNFSSRKFIDPDYIFHLKLPPGQARTIYFKIKSMEGIQLPFKIGSERQLQYELKNKGILSGIYTGIMLVMFLYNLFLFHSTKDKGYLYYIIYVGFIFLTQTSLQGYTFQYLWPDHPIIARYALFIFPSMSGITGILFMSVFLKLKTIKPYLNKIAILLCLPYFISLTFVLFNNPKASQMILEMNSLIISIFMLITPIIILKTGFKPAKFFLLAWSVFLIGILTYILKDFEVLPFNNFTRYTMQIGSAIETVLLSFALADRINTLKREKEQSQTKMFDAMKENEKLIKEQNVLLENKVQERTNELNKINEELNKAIANLKNTQTKLVNAEKMATVGQLTAGIAHEINNPINFVSGNIRPLKLDIDDILELIKKYEKFASENRDLDQKSIDEFRNKIDISLLKTEMNELLSGIEEGAKRTAEIVAGLRNFSRLDESEIKEVNINEGITSTLVLLRSAVPPNTKVITSLGEIPLIECYPGKLNQVFMNVINNAFYAIRVKEGDTENKIYIQSYLEKDKIIVEIEDSGIGMSDETRKKIFEPFFSTKKIGEGTGLGMSIVNEIINNHNADIFIDSQLGRGTKVKISLNKTLISKK